MLISKRVFIGTIVIMASLIVGWAFLFYYGGEKVSVGGDEFYFFSSELEENETVVLYLINDETPVIALVTDKDNAAKAVDFKTFKHLTGHSYHINPYERRNIEFTAPRTGEYGLLVRTESDLERATFRIQVIEPLTLGHLRYSIYVLILFTIIIILVSLIYSFYGKD